VDNRRHYLLTFLPPLPDPGEPLPITLPEALARLRQQGGRDLEQLARALEAEADVRDSLDEWVLSPPGSRAVPAALPTPLVELFDEGRMAAAGEETWIEAVWRAWFELVAGVGRDIGSRLIPRWAAWELALRLRLAGVRGLSRGGASAGGLPEEREEIDLDGILAAWDAVRERGRGGLDLAAAMEAEKLLERARLEFLARESSPYSFSMDELASYLLRLRLLERRRRLDPARGRELLREAAAL